MLGDLTKGNVRIANLPLESAFEAAYAAYVDERLAKIAVINMRAYNYTVNGTSAVLNPVPRPSQVYSFEVPEECEVEVKRLYANGSRLGNDT
jgi:hypothetical protein